MQDSFLDFIELALQDDRLYVEVDELDRYKNKFIRFASYANYDGIPDIIVTVKENIIELNYFDRTPSYFKNVYDLYKKCSFFNDYYKKLHK